MSNTVIITEYVRFNADGSSDHIKVIGDELFSVEHFPETPYVIVDKDISWIINTTKKSVFVPKQLNPDERIQQEDEL